MYYDGWHMGGRLIIAGISLQNWLFNTGLFVHLTIYLDVTLSGLSPERLSLQEWKSAVGKPERYNRDLRRNRFIAFRWLCLT